MVNLDLGGDDLFREFLTEVQALDDFRSEYQRRYDFEGLGRDDQDVRRLMEAMAFYTARTRGGVQRALHRYKLQALEQLFPHLLSPMPAMALLYPVLTSNVTETRRLSRSAEIQVAAAPPASPASARAAVALAAPAAEVAPPRLFRALADITVYPLHLVERSVRLTKAVAAQTASAGLTAASSPTASTAGPGPAAPGATGPSLLSLTLAASPRALESKRYYADVQLPLGELTLYVNPQGDALYALRLFDALSQSLTRVTARFFSGGEQRHEIATRRVRFGLPVAAGDGWENPIELARRSIHFPLAELCLAIPLAGAPAEWTWMTLDLELDERWPANLAITDQTFLLNAGPIENVARRTAEPIDADGTRTRHRIEHQEPSSGMKVREILGVYQGDPATPGARTTLLPSALAGEGYTLAVEGRGPSRETWLETDSARGSLTAIERLYIDAEWFAPDPVLPNGREAHVSVEDHDLGALVWRVSDPLRPPHESAFLGDAKALDRLLDLHGRRLSSVADLELLLQVLGVEESEVFGRVPRYVESLTSSFAPDARSATGGVRAYDIGLGQLPPVLVPAARLLFRLLPGILGTWTGDMQVQVRVAAEAFDPNRPVLFEWRASDEG
ncbi:MAG TPA: type VI secretion system baseplate subunit TssF [Polyangiaceae bacterium]|nr:type VI secretion system baseplate subunit TssF [Polyangiaceae bacterium]